jgi:hypothetical protein
MNCATFEQGLARIVTGEVEDEAARLLLGQLQRHARECEACEGGGALLDLLARPAAEREIADDPGADYWSTFEERLRPRLRAKRAVRVRWWASVAAVLLVALLAGWLLRGAGEAPADGAVGPGRASGGPNGGRPEFPASLIRSLDQASDAEVEDQLAALEELSSGDLWFGAEAAGPDAWDGGLFPEVESLDAETRQRLLDWLRDQNRDAEGAKG